MVFWLKFKGTAFLDSVEEIWGTLWYKYTQNQWSILPSFVDLGFSCGIQANKFDFHRDSMDRNRMEGKGMWFEGREKKNEWKIPLFLLLKLSILFLLIWIQFYAHSIQHIVANWMIVIKPKRSMTYHQQSSVWIQYSLFKL